MHKRSFIDKIKVFLTNVYNQVQALSEEWCYAGIKVLP